MKQLRAKAWFLAAAGWLAVGTCTSLLAQRDFQGLRIGPTGPAHWVLAWAPAMMAPTPGDTLPAGALNGITLRETVHLAVGGNRIQLRLSNLVGEQPLVVRDVTVAIPATDKPDGAIRQASWKPVLFGGRPGVSIAPGAEAVSDALNYNVRAGGDLVVSIATTTVPATPTLHVSARETEYLLPGDHADEPTLPGATTDTRWYLLSGVDVEQHTVSPAVSVAFGDSITDGHGSTLNANDRYPDYLEERLQAAATTASNSAASVINKGIGGNCVLKVCTGPSAIDRFSRDVLDVPEARTVILLEGINDLGALSRMSPQPAAAHTDLVLQIEAAYKQLAASAHAHGLRLLGGTLTPWMGNAFYHPDAQAEADRTALNTWIRNSKAFDGVIDFDAAVRDPQHPDQMLPAYDSGDHLHPGPAGYRKMADAIDLQMLQSGR